MKPPPTHWLTLIAGLALLLLGALWALQGFGVLRGSVMTGQNLWLVVGSIVALIGLGLIYRSLTARPGKA